MNERKPMPPRVHAQLIRLRKAVDQELESAQRHAITQRVLSVMIALCATGIVLAFVLIWR